MHNSACLFVRCIAALTALMVSLSAGFTPAAASGAISAGTIQRIVRSSMAANHLKAAIVQVRSNGNTVYTAAFGDSMARVPATPDMHFRNGALAFTYMSTLLLVFVDQKKVTLDTKLAAYMPKLPSANRITLRNLANMTSGYADYVYQPELLNGIDLNPFRQWTADELIHIGVTKPMMFAPERAGATRTPITLSSAKCSR